MAKDKAVVVRIEARHATRLDRKGNPVTKSFSPLAWSSLHDDQWIQTSEAPAPLKTKAVAPKKVTVKKPAQAKASPKKAVVKKATTKKK